MMIETNAVQENSFTSNALRVLVREGCAIGDAQWWETISSENLPLLIAEEGEYTNVVFLWRDRPDLNGKQIKEVYIDINGVTDHHCFTMAKLSQIAGTDVWVYLAKIKKNWRCGYSFMPVSLAHTQPHYVGSIEEKKAQHRQWLRQVFPLSCHDVLNQNEVNHCEWGRSKSPLHMPHAISQASWEPFDRTSGQSQQNADSAWVWDSSLLNVSRDIWLYSTSKASSKNALPLVFMLDGRFWSQSMPIYDALLHATEHGVLPAANYVLIDEVSGQQRNHDLSANPQFWEAIIQELFPLLSTHFLLPCSPKQTAVVGQSLGGLSAMYAGLHWPEYFGSVVCQSGSFWWPDFSLVKPPSEYTPPSSMELLTEMSHQVHRGLGSSHPLTVFMEVGRGEDIMVDLSLDMYNQLAQQQQQQQHNIQYRVFDGGHDRLCWRGGIIDGLSYVFNCESQQSEWS